jgi:hypothetical protein
MPAGIDFGSSKVRLSLFAGIDSGGLTYKFFNVISAPLFKKTFSTTERGQLS